MKVGYVTGSFDPITVGHLDLIKKAQALFDRVVVLMLVNEQKNYTFDVDTRLRLIRLALSDMTSVEVDFFGGYGVDYVKAHGGGTFVRGVRDDRDASYEKQLADWNREHGVDTLLLPAEAGREGLSSHEVRENLKRGKIIGVCEAVETELKRMLGL